MKQRVILVNDTITITGSVRLNNYTYDFPIDKLITRDVDDQEQTQGDNQLAFFILLLNNKIHIEKNSLYELAKITDEHFPDHTFDWIKTFYIVERKFLYDAYEDKRQLNAVNREEKNYNANRFFERMNMEISEDSNISQRKAIEDVVLKNLKTYKIRVDIKEYNKKSK